MKENLTSEDYKRELAELARFPDMNPGPVLRMNFEGEVLLSNAAAQKLFGHDLHDKNWKNICPTVTNELWNKILSCDEVFPVETSIDDLTFVFNHRTDPKTQLVFVFGTDITERKLYERELKKQKTIIEEIARFPHMNPGPVLRLDFSGKILLSNIAAEKLFGEDLLGKNWKDICNVIDSEIWHEVLSSEVVFPVETSIADLTFVFNHRTDPKTQLVFVFGTDITERKLYERELKKQKTIIEEIARFPHMNPGPVLRMDFSGKILLSNIAAEKLFGEDLLGKNWRDICNVINREIWHDVLTSNVVIPIETLIGDKVYTLSHRCDAGSKLVFVFGTDITLQRLAEKQLRQSEKMATLGTLAAGVAHEINNPAAAAKRASHQLYEQIENLEAIQQKMVGIQLSDQEISFMSDLSLHAEKHAGTGKNNSRNSFDLEADLEEWLESFGLENAWEIAPVLGNSGIDKNFLIEKASGLNNSNAALIINLFSAQRLTYELLSEINECSSRISEIVKALKDYSFLDQAPVQNVNLHDGIENTLVILKHKLKNGITINREYDDKLPKITAYGSELNQVWTNLIDNAVEAMNGNGVLTLRTGTDSQYIEVQIEDNGPGIPDAIQSRIFDPFFTTKEPGKGTGLGLSVSYGIITEKHNGTITVDSKPGRTKFTVKLPLV